MLIQNLNLQLLSQHFPDAKLICRSSQPDSDLWSFSDLRVPRTVGYLLPCTLYVGTEQEYAGLDDSGKFILAADDSFNCRECDDVLLLPSDTDLTTVLQRLADLFSEYYTAQTHLNTLKNAVFSASLSNLANAVAQIFSCSVVIINSLGDSLASTSNSGIEPLLSLFPTPPCIPNCFEFADAIQLLPESYYCGVSLDGELIAYLLLSDHPMLHNSFAPLICDAILNSAKSIFRQLDILHPGQKFPSELFVADLIHDESMTDQMLISRSSLSGFSDKGFFSLLLLDISNYPLDRPSMIRLIDSIESSGFTISVVENGILCLLLILSDPGQLSSRIKDIGLRTQTLNCHGVYSRVFYDIRAFYPIYKRTSKALFLPTETDDRIVSYETLEWQTMISWMNVRNISELHPIVQTLIAEEHKFKFSLTDTLYAYLCCSQRAAQAADILNIHRNTFDYRLKRILDIAPFDLADGKLTTVVMLSLAAYKELESQSS